jgi:hypothetical protein
MLVLVAVFQQQLPFGMGIYQQLFDATPSKQSSPKTKNTDFLKK